MTWQRVGDLSKPVLLMLAATACLAPPSSLKNGDDGDTELRSGDFDPARSLVVSSESAAVADGEERIRIRVTVRDALGEGVADLTVTLEATGSGHVIEQPASPTDATGATTGFLSSTKAETKTITARVETDLGPIRLPARPRVTFLPGPAAALAFAVEPGSAQAGTVLSPAIEVVVLDRFENTVPDATAEITLSLTGGDGSAVLAGETTRTTANGIATFDDLSVDVAADAYRLKATADGLTAAQSGPFSITLGPPARLEFVEAPSGGVAREALSPVRVALKDTSGNTLQTATTPVTLSLKGHPGRLEGALVAHPVDGVATFTNLQVSRPHDAYVLIATASGFAGAQSDPFPVAPAPPASLAFEVQPEMIGAGRPFENALRVLVLDDLDERVEGDSTEVTLTLTGGDPAASLLGTTQLAAVDGAATFPDVAIDRPGADYVLVASATGLSPARSATFDVLEIPPPRLVIDGAPATGAIAGERLGVVTVRLVDETDTLLPDSLTQVTLEALGQTTLLGATAAVAVDGVATFDDLHFETATRAVRLVASADGFVAGETDPFDVLPSSPQTLAFHVQPRDAAPGTSVGPVEVELRDRFGNRADAQAEIALSLSEDGEDGGAGPAAELAVEPATAMDGLAHFEDVIVPFRGVGFRLVASADGFEAVTSDPFHVGDTHVVHVGAGGATFAPDDLTIRPGEEVRWEFESSGHTVTSGTGGTPDGRFCSPTNEDCASAPASSKGETFAHRFLEEGEFPYFCRPHFPSMTGIVRVEEE